MENTSCKVLEVIEVNCKASTAHRRRLWTVLRRPAAPPRPLLMAKTSSMVYANQRRFATRTYLTLPLGLTHIYQPLSDNELLNAVTDSSGVGIPTTEVKGPRHARSTHIVESGRIASHRSLAGCHAGCPEAHIWYVRTRPVEERVSSLSSTASSRASLGISHLLRLCAASVQLFLSALPAAARAG